MKTTSAWLKSWPVAAAAVAFALGGLGTARADTYIHNAWGNSNVIFGPPCNNPPASALQFNATRNPTDGNPPLQGNKLLMLSDASYTQPTFNCVESTTWTSTSAQRKAATVDGVYYNPNPTSVDDVYLPIGRSITLRDLTLQNVDLSTETVDFNFRPVSGDSSLTLNNGSLTSLSRPGFYLHAHFTLTASGDSLIKDWTGRIESQTTLNVNPGATLTLDWCGNMNATLVTSSMYFGQIDNAATIDGGTLRLQQSYVTFGTSAFDPAHPSKMTFKNTARLEVTGDRSTLVADEFDFINSTLMLANNNNLRVRGTLNLDTASVVVGSDGEIHVPALAVKGLSTMALGNPGDPRFQPVQAGALQMQPDAVLTLTGQGGLQTGFLAFVAPGSGHQYGQIIVNDSAALITGTDAIFQLPRGEVVTINRTDANVYGMMIAKNGGVIEYGLSNQVTNHLTNHGQISVEDGGALNFYGDCHHPGGQRRRGEHRLRRRARRRDGRRAAGDQAPDDQQHGHSRHFLDAATDARPDRIRPMTRSASAARSGSRNGPASTSRSSTTRCWSPERSSSWSITTAGRATTQRRPSTAIRTAARSCWDANTYQIKYADSGDAGYAGAITLTVVAPRPAGRHAAPGHANPERDRRRRLHAVGRAGPERLCRHGDVLDHPDPAGGPQPGDRHGRHQRRPHRVPGIEHVHHPGRRLDQRHRHGDGHAGGCEGQPDHHLQPAASTRPTRPAAASRSAPAPVPACR